MAPDREPDSSDWFSYLLEPDKLTSDLETGQLTPDLLRPLLLDLLTNLINNQASTTGLFTDNPQELWYGKSTERQTERKSLVLPSLCLRVAARYFWHLGELETILSPPLLLYLLTSLVQAQPGQLTPANTPPSEAGAMESQASLADTRTHAELDPRTLGTPGPALAALVLLHRWVVRTFMVIKTPQRTERSSTVMVPGVRRDPALLFRDQTNTLVFAVVQTSIKFLAGVLEAEAAPLSVPSHHSFPTILTTSAPGYRVPSWDPALLVPCDKSIALATIAYDLGCCYFFCEDYARARACFTSYFTLATQDPSLGGEVDSGRLAGYLLCLGMEQPTVTPPQVSLGDRLATVGARTPYEDLPNLLAEDTVNVVGRESRNEDWSAREVVELQLSVDIAGDRVTAARDYMPSVVVSNLIFRTLRGYPLTLRTRRLLSKMPEKTLRVVEQLLERLLGVTTPSQRRLLRCLVLEMVAHNLVSSSSRAATLLLGGEAGEVLHHLPPRPRVKQVSFLLETFGQDKVASLNTSLQLLASFTASQVTSLATSLGQRLARKTTSRWTLESDVLGRQNLLPDLVFILLAKVQQLRRLKRWVEAKQLLYAVQNELRAGGSGGGKAGVSPPPWLGGQVEGELLLADLQAMVGKRQQASEDILARCGNCLSSDQAPSPVLVQSCLVTLLTAGDWEGVGRLSHSNMPYVVSFRTSGSPVFTVVGLARNISFLMLNLRTSNHQMVKKFGRDVWDTVAHLVSTAANKRQKTEERHSAAVTLSRDRALVSTFLQRLTSHPGLAALVLSLLASLFNVARDDPNTDLLSVHASVWPTGLATNQAIQERTVEELLNSSLTSAMTSSPKDPSLLRLSADLQFAKSRYSAAIGFYVESVAVRTEFFQQDCGPPAWLLEEAVVARLVTCCREMGRLTQAVVLCQFSPEPNYAQAFKFLEDQTEDGGDSLYGCVWDMAVLEFAMSLHTRRGEVARRREAKHCIWQLELNTNNDEEIIKEAANVRKSMFLRSLALQFF